MRNTHVPRRRSINHNNKYIEWDKVLQLGKKPNDSVTSHSSKVNISLPTNDTKRVKYHDADKKRYSFAFDKLFNNQNSKKKLNKKFLNLLFKMSQNKIRHSDIQKDLENASEGKNGSNSSIRMQRCVINICQNVLEHIRFYILVQIFFN